MQRLDQATHFSVSAAIILPSSTADIQSETLRRRAAIAVGEYHAYA
jgi:hypothetical protein